MTLPQNPLGEIGERLATLESMVRQLIEMRTVKDWYSTEDLAKQLNKAEFTIREWCRLGRIRAVKRQFGRGPHAAWVVSHDELLRYQRDGLIPLTKN